MALDKASVIGTCAVITHQAAVALGVLAGKQEHSVRRLGVYHSLRPGGARLATRVMRFRTAFGRKKAVCRIRG